MDPYQILGVSPNADEETIKKAYRNLSKQYHPDNNPGNKAAEERFKTVQAAYEKIMDMRKNGSYTSYRDMNDSDYSSFFGFNAGRNAGDDSGELMRAAEFVRSGRYYDAARILDSIQYRGGDWYYLSAICQYNLGNNSVALDYARRAYSIDPQNYNYRDLVERMEGSANRYENRYDSYDHSSSVSNACCRMIICNAALNICCGGGLRC
ncbi:MAG: DnaJ domain-containing protein [Lachnospiraceae bacterium]|nr:DnaJ domain-containing protein [Lachnospiraceae bacterium]